jgi:hypothetical protein
MHMGLLLLLFFQGVSHWDGTPGTPELPRWEHHSYFEHTDSLPTNVKTETYSFGVNKPLPPPPKQPNFLLAHEHLGGTFSFLCLCGCE